MRVEQRVVTVGDAVPVGVGNTRELGLLAGDHRESLAVLHHHAQAVEQSLGEQSPFTIHNAPDARGARAHDNGAVLRHRQSQCLEQLVAAVVVLGRVVVSML
jgi:hypothetical protein